MTKVLHVIGGWKAPSSMDELIFHAWTYMYVQIQSENPSLECIITSVLLVLGWGQETKE
jgi:hypothetical protein